MSACEPTVVTSVLSSKLGLSQIFSDFGHEKCKKIQFDNVEYDFTCLNHGRTMDL